MSARLRQAVSASEATLTEGLVSLVRRKPIEQADYDAMALFALDGVANMLAGRRADPGR